MHQKLSVMWVGILVMWSCPAAQADGFDGTKTLLCENGNGVQYHRNGDPQPFHPESVGLPQKFIIDFKKKKIRPTRESVVQRQSKIKRIEQVEEKILLQGADDGVDGVEDGIGWTIAVMQRSGRFVITASGSDVGYIIFGTCREPPP